MRAKFAAAIAAFGLLGAAPAPAGLPGQDEAAAAVAKACGDHSAEAYAALPAAEARVFLNCLTRAVATELRKQLPIKVDEVTTVSGVEVDGAILTYKVAFDVDKASVTPAMLDILRTSTRKNVCGTDDMRWMIEAGAGYRYSWADRAGAPLGDLLVASC